MSTDDGMLLPRGPGIRGLADPASGRGRVRVIADADCVRLRKALGDGPADAPGVCCLLRAALALPPGVRVVLDEHRRPWLEGEIGMPGDEAEEDWSGRVAACAASLEQAEGWPAVAATAACGEEETFPAEVAEMLQSDGQWPVHNRSAGLAVDLDTEEGLVQAKLFARHGAILVEVEVLRAEAPWPVPVAEALAVLLLSVASGVRLVRACSGPAGGDVAVWFQVSLPRRRVSPGSLRDALGSLSLAWGEAVEEAGVLQSPDAACRYLAMCGWGGAPA